MKKTGLTRSMSKKGCSPDNAACEAFFGRLKNEMFYNHSWINVSLDEFIESLDSYIHWYSTGRIKMSLSAMSPMHTPLPAQLQPFLSPILIRYIVRSIHPEIRIRIKKQLRRF